MTGADSLFTALKQNNACNKTKKCTVMFSRQCIFKANTFFAVL